MASGTAVTVFVDDAVCGRFPPVCAKTGRPGDGRLSLAHDVVTGGEPSEPLAQLAARVLPVAKPPHPARLPGRRGR